MFPGVSPSCVWACHPLATFQCEDLTDTSHTHTHTHQPHSSPWRKRAMLSHGPLAGRLMPSWDGERCSAAVACSESSSEVQGAAPRDPGAFALGGHAVSKCGFSSFVCEQLLCNTGLDSARMPPLELGALQSNPEQRTTSAETIGRASSPLPIVSLLLQT